MTPVPLALAIHGGAGDGAGDWSAHRAALRRIASDGLARLRAGASAVDAVQALVQQLEDDPLFNSGIGAVLNRDGQPELDAAIMDGDGRRCGAVSGVSRVRSPVALARAVMDRSPHVYFTGLGAEALARELGLPMVEPEFFVTRQRRDQLAAARKRGRIELDHDDEPAGEGDGLPRDLVDPAGRFGTVGAVARDARGHLAAATSTGGMTNKHPGRVGDTPVIGAGTFADDGSVALSCTGTGEAFIRAGFGFHVHARLAAGAPLDAACAEALELVRRYKGRGGCIAVDRGGGVATPFNSQVMLRAWLEDGRVRVAVGPDDAE